MSITRLREGSTVLSLKELSDSILSAHWGRTFLLSAVVLQLLLPGSLLIFEFNPSLFEALSIGKLLILSAAIGSPLIALNTWISAIAIRKSMIANRLPPLSMSDQQATAVARGTFASFIPLYGAVLIRVTFDSRMGVTILSAILIQSIVFLFTLRK